MSGELAVQDHGRETQHRRRRGEDDEHEVEGELVALELVERRLERHREQEAREDLGAGLHGAKLLQDIVPLAVETLAVGLLADLGVLAVGVGRIGVGGVHGVVGGFGFVRHGRILAAAPRKLQGSRQYPWSRGWP